MYLQANETNSAIVRIIVIEQDISGYSFLLTKNYIQPLLASLAMNPATFVALLQSIDAISSGSAGMIMEQFIHTDRKRLIKVYSTFSPDLRLFSGEDAWPITDEATFQTAAHTGQAEKMMIYLAEKSIRTTMPYMYSQMTGELHFFDGAVFLQETVTYDLRANWQFSLI